MNPHICVFFQRPWIKNNGSHIIAFRIRPLRSQNTVGFMRKDRKYEKKIQGFDQTLGIMENSTVPGDSEDIG